MQGTIRSASARWFAGTVAPVDERVWRYLELMQIISARTLKTRYRGSVLGVFWSLSNPIVMTAVYAMIFGTAFASYYQGSIVRYVVATFVGLGVLNVFTGTTSQALSSIVANGGLLNKIRLPFSIFPVSSVAANFFQFFVGTFPVLCLVTAFEARNVVNVAALLVPAAALILVVLGFSLLTSALNVYFRDMPYMWEIISWIVWMTSPIFYPAALLPARIQPYLALNPITNIVTSFRQIALSKAWPDGHLMLAALASGVVWAAIGWLAFNVIKRDFMDLL